MMSEWICKEVQTDNGGYLEPVKPLVRCKDCEHHGKRTNMCSIWHAHTKPEGYCHRGKIYGKE